MDPISNEYGVDEPTPKKIKTGMESTDECVDAVHTAGEHACALSFIMWQ